MKTQLCAAVIAVATLAGTASAQKVSPVQAAARPQGLQPYAPVYLTGSDARSASFNTNNLPYFKTLINTSLGEGQVLQNSDGFRLDASRLFLRTQSNQPIRVYFVHEGAGYHNTLGFSMTPAGSTTPGTRHLIFPDASFQGTNSKKRTASDPLVVGDWVEIGSGGPGMQLDFFCIANGASSSPVATWYNNKNLNPDGLQHVVAFMMPNTPFLLIGFEDLWGGGDLDYNDCLFVVDIGQVNADNLFDDSTLPN